MELALRGLQWSTCLIYLDDVLIFGTTFEEHLERLNKVLERIQKASLKLKPEKCSLMQAEVPFLGHIVSRHGIQPNPDNIAKVMSWSEPTNVTEVRQFLGLCSYYRRFIRDFAVIAKPLTELTCNDSELVWTDRCQHAFEELKASLVGPDIMAYPRDDAPFILDTDACDVGIGAVLSQTQNGKERVIAYASRSLNKAERNYCVTDKELLAIKNFVEHFRQYLLGREFLIRTDHQALKWLFSLKEPKGRIARWIEILSAYNFTVEYRPGKKHGNADGMSRHPSHSSLDSLACGPCGRCKKRSEDMQSAWCPTGQTRRTQTQASGLAEGGWLSTLWHSVLVLVSLLWLLMQCAAQTLRKFIELMGLGISPVGDDHDLHHAVHLLRDDGRLWPKLIQPVQRLIKRMVTRSTKDVPQVTSWFQSHSLDDLNRIQKEDSCMGKVFEWLDTGAQPSVQKMCSASPELRHYWNLRGTLELHNGLLFRRFHHRDGKSSHLQFLVPKALRKEVLEASHNSLWAGHLGNKKTAQRIFGKFYWYALREDVSRWLAQCDTCAANKPLNKKPKAPLGDMRVGAPLDRLCIDILGPFPVSLSGNRYILVVCDAFTKWVEVFPIQDQTASTCANILVNEVIARYGCPHDLHSDQGRAFESTIFKQMCELLQIRKTRTSPHHPQCNGQCERFNRTLLSMIRTSINGCQEEWDQKLNFLTAAYRATPHETTGLNPNLMMLGREVRLPGEFPVLPNSEQTSPGAYSLKLRETLESAHELARQNLHRKASKQSAAYDVKSSLNIFKPGDYVWYLDENRTEGISPKLQPIYKGPVVVIQKLNTLDYKIQLDKTGTIKVVHHNKLKPYAGTTILPWANRAVKNLMD